MGNHLVSKGAKAPSDLDLNIISEADDTISADSTFQGLTTCISKEDALRLGPCWGLKNNKRWSFRLPTERDVKNCQPES